MDIIIINGSPRKNGATSKFLHRMEEKLLLHKDVSVEFVNIGELNIMPCSGCCSCYKTGHCFINDDAEKLSARIEKADGLIIGSPTYASNISGQLKLFIDRGHFVIEQLLYGKYAISVATGENYGSKDTSKILNKLLQYSGAVLSGKMVLNLPFNSTPQNSSIEKRLNLLAEKLYADIKGKKKYLFQLIIHKIIFFIGIKPFVMSKGKQYQGVVAKWNNSHAVLRNN